MLNRPSIIVTQAQEFHRAQHPSHHRAHGGHSGGGGAGGAHGGGHAGGRGGHNPHPDRYQQRDEQLKLALEANPEAFVPVQMLYVSCTLNDVPVKAFIDTGAQMTVMNVQCAQKCNLLHLVDKRFKGVAAGVGTAPIHGRVHMATVRFGKKAAVDIAIVVMEMNGGPELLLGLDVMRKYQ